MAKEAKKLFGWLDRKFSNIQRDEATVFRDSLRGANQEVLDMAAASAFFWAAIYKAQGADLYEMEMWIQNEPTFPSGLVSNIKALQKQGSETSAVGLMIWLHSARALMYPELRIFGREIWTEISRASNEAESNAVRTLIRAKDSGRENSASISLMDIDRERIPSGLEPIGR